MWKVKCPLTAVKTRRETVCGFAKKKESRVTLTKCNNPFLPQNSTMYDKSDIEMIAHWILEKSTSTHWKCEMRVCFKPLRRILVVWTTRAGTPGRFDVTLNLNDGLKEWSNFSYGTTWYEISNNGFVFILW